MVSEVQNFSCFLDRPEQTQPIEAIDGPADNPHIGNLLKGNFPGLGWLRVGPNRVTYEIHEGEVLVLSLRGAHRKDVYS